jgi:Ribbon-helix-helix domain
VQQVAAQLPWGHHMVLLYRIKDHPTRESLAILSVYVCLGGYMSTEEAVRWNIKVSKETDLSLRSFLGSQGMRKGDLSKFIEQAVLAHVFHRTVEDIQARNRNVDPAEIEAEIDAAIREAREEAQGRRRVRQRKA